MSVVHFGTYRAEVKWEEEPTRLNSGSIYRATGKSGRVTVGGPAGDLQCDLLFGPSDVLLLRPSGDGWQVVQGRPQCDKTEQLATQLKDSLRLRFGRFWLTELGLRAEVLSRSLLSIINSDTPVPVLVAWNDGWMWRFLTTDPVERSERAAARFLGAVCKQLEIRTGGEFGGLLARDTDEADAWTRTGVEDGALWRLAVTGVARMPLPTQDWVTLQPAFLDGPLSETASSTCRLIERPGRKHDPVLSVRWSDEIPARLAISAKPGALLDVVPLALEREPDDAHPSNAGEPYWLRTDDGWLSVPVASQDGVVPSANIPRELRACALTSPADAPARLTLLPDSTRGAIELSIGLSVAGERRLDVWDPAVLLESGRHALDGAVMPSPYSPPVESWRLQNAGSHYVEVESSARPLVFISKYLTRSEGLALSLQKVGATIEMTLRASAAGGTPPLEEWARHAWWLTAPHHWAANATPDGDISPLRTLLPRRFHADASVRLVLTRTGWRVESKDGAPQWIPGSDSSADPTRLRGVSLHSARPDLLGLEVSSIGPSTVEGRARWAVALTDELFGQDSTSVLGEGYEGSRTYSDVCEAYVSGEARAIDLGAPVPRWLLDRVGQARDATGTVAEPESPMTRSGPIAGAGLHLSIETLDDHVVRWSLSQAGPDSPWAGWVVTPVSLTRDGDAWCLGIRVSARDDDAPTRDARPLIEGSQLVLRLRWHGEQFGWAGVDSGRIVVSGAAFVTRAVNRPPGAEVGDGAHIDNLVALALDALSMDTSDAHILLRFTRARAWVRVHGQVVERTWICAGTLDESGWIDGLLDGEEAPIRRVVDGDQVHLVVEERVTLVGCVLTHLIASTRVEQADTWKLISPEGQVLADVPPAHVAVAGEHTHLTYYLNADVDGTYPMPLDLGSILGVELAVTRLNCLAVRVTRQTDGSSTVRGFIGWQAGTLAGGRPEGKAHATLLLQDDDPLGELELNGLWEWPRVAGGDTEYTLSLLLWDARLRGTLRRGSDRVPVVARHGIRRTKDGRSQTVHALHMALVSPNGIRLAGTVVSPVVEDVGGGEVARHRRPGLRLEGRLSWRVALPLGLALDFDVSTTHLLDGALDIESVDTPLLAPLPPYTLGARAGDPATLREDDLNLPDPPDDASTAGLRLWLAPDFGTNQRTVGLTLDARAANWVACGVTGIETDDTETPNPPEVWILAESEGAEGTLPVRRRLEVLDANSELAELRRQAQALLAVAGWQRPGILSATVDGRPHWELVDSQLLDTTHPLGVFTARAMPDGHIQYADAAGLLVADGRAPSLQGPVVYQIRAAELSREFLTGEAGHVLQVGLEASGHEVRRVEELIVERTLPFLPIGTGPARVRGPVVTMSPQTRDGHGGHVDLPPTPVHVGLAAPRPGELTDWRLGTTWSADGTVGLSAWHRVRARHPRVSGDAAPLQARRLEGTSVRDPLSSLRRWEVTFGDEKRPPSDTTDAVTLGVVSPTPRPSVTWGEAASVGVSWNARAVAGSVEGDPWLQLVIQTKDVRGPFDIALGTDGIGRGVGVRITLGRSSALEDDRGYECEFAVRRPQQEKKDDPAPPDTTTWQVSVVQSPDEPTSDVEWLDAPLTDAATIPGGAPVEFEVTTRRSSARSPRLVGIVRGVDHGRLVGYGPWDARWRFVTSGARQRAWVRQGRFFDVCGDEAPQYSVFDVAPDGAVRRAMAITVAEGS